jgi:hypothetical protein
MAIDKLEVVQDKLLYSNFKDTDKLYLVVWERTMNHGLIYLWAKDEQEAIERIGYNPKFVKMTCIEINPASMPMEIGTRN